MSFKKPRHSDPILAYADWLACFVAVTAALCPPPTGPGGVAKTIVIQNKCLVSTLLK
jgi:hypothetical protein